MPKGIYQHKPLSEETKRKLSMALKGRMPKFIPDNTGLIRSAETRKKIGDFWRGKKQSKETIEKRSASRRGRPLSDEHRKKLSEAKKGNKGSNWRGGLKPINKKIRAGLEFRLWREAVFKRDNFICQKCEIQGGELQPHHILNFADWHDLRFAVHNGITLCKKDHSLFHKLYGQQHNNGMQLNKFIYNDRP